MQQFLGDETAESLFRICKLPANTFQLDLQARYLGVECSGVNVRE
jgi:hypothetical protein